MRQGNSDAVNILHGLASVVNYTTMVYQESANRLMARARSGDPNAEYELAMRYQSGAWDVRQDDAKALEWLLKSANLGNRLAMQTLAHVYGQGELGVDADARQSAYWQQRATQIR